MVCTGSLRIKVISNMSPEIVGYVMLNYCVSRKVYRTGKQL